MRSNVKVTGVARLYCAAFVWTAGLGIFDASGSIANNAAGFQKYSTTNTANAPPARSQFPSLTSINPGNTATVPAPASAKTVLKTEN